MAKVLLELDVFFDGNKEEITKKEVEEFTRVAIESAEECSGSCTIKIKKLEVIEL